MKMHVTGMIALAAVMMMGSHVAGAANDPMATDPVMNQVSPSDASPANVTPVILGEVSESSEHSVTLNTARGEHMEFEIDSRTVMPLRLSDGARVKVEFHLMDNGMHHAGRISALAAGSAEWTRLDQQLSALQNRRDSDVATSADVNTPIADNTPAATTDNMSNSAAPTNTLESGTAAGNSNASISEDRDATPTPANRELPRTASSRIWLLVLGLGVFAAAFGQRIVRRFSI